MASLCCSYSIVFVHQEKQTKFRVEPAQKYNLVKIMMFSVSDGPPKLLESDKDLVVRQLIIVMC